MGSFCRSFWLLRHYLLQHIEVDVRLNVPPSVRVGRLFVTTRNIVNRSLIPTTRNYRGSSSCFGVLIVSWLFVESVIKSHEKLPSIVLYALTPYIIKCKNVYYKCFKDQIITQHIFKTIWKNPFISRQQCQWQNTV